MAGGPPGWSGLPEFGSKADASAGIVVFYVCIMHDSVFRILRTEYVYGVLDKFVSPMYGVYIIYTPVLCI